MKSQTKINIVTGAALLLITGVGLNPSIDSDWMLLIALFSVAIMSVIVSDSPEIKGN